MRRCLQSYMAWSYSAILAGFDGTPSPEKSPHHEFCLARASRSWLRHNGERELSLGAKLASHEPRG